MKDMTLVVSATGMDSRYGGLKQINPIGPDEEIILEMSAFGAIRANFNKIVFIIKGAIEEGFRKAIGDKIADHIKAKYIFQEVDACLPKGYEIPVDCAKLWGMVHVILCCKSVIYEPLTVINTDDYYGIVSFQKLHGYLVSNKDGAAYSTVDFVLGNTLADHGSVVRGVCKVEDGKLTGVDEHTRIERHEGKVQYHENDT